VTTEKETTPADIALTERRAFAPSEMIECSGCARANPPNRSNCLYCGFALETSHLNHAQQLALTTAAPEQGSLSHVVLASGEVSETGMSELAAVSNLRVRELEALLSSAGNVAICAVDSARADSICARLRALDLQAFTVADEQLDLEVEPKGLRTIEVTDDSMVAVARRAGERVTVKWDDVILIVAGRLLVSTLEIEKKKRGGQERTLEEREFLADEAVLDIYVRNDEFGWRIKSGSFDFSFLGDEKSITAFQNFSSLTNVLRERAINADFDDAYNRLRSILGKIWPSEPIEGKTERRRAGARRIQAIVASKDNVDEFTRYSRLRRFLKARELDNIR
jgi:hypothetical protein